MQAFTRVQTLKVAEELRSLDQQMLDMMRMWTCEVGACQCCIADKTPAELMKTMTNSFPKYCVGIGSAIERLAQRLEDVYAMVDQAAYDDKVSQSTDYSVAPTRVHARDPSPPRYEQPSVRRTHQVTHITERLDSRKRSRHEQSTNEHRHERGTSDRDTPAKLFTRSFARRTGDL